MRHVREGVTRSVAIRTPWIQLGALLKLAGLADTGGQAKLLIQAGSVRVNGAPEGRRSRKVVPGDTVEVEGRAAIAVRVSPS